MSVSQSNHWRGFRLLAFVCALAVLSFACNPGGGAAGAGGSVSLQGAGATFPNPLYQKWLSEYGKLHGNVNVSDRVDIRAEGALTGDVVAHRLSIEDGAFFKGSVDLKKSEQKLNSDAAKNAKPEPAQNHSQPQAMSAAAGKLN